MASVAATARRQALITRPLTAAWPLWFVVATYPVFWVVGAGYVIWPVLTFPILLGLAARRTIRIPPAFGLWLFFLLCMSLSVIEVDTSLRLVLFCWRASVYLTATAVFLWIFNTPRDRLSNRSVALAMTLFWAETIVGGMLGVLLPGYSFHSPIEHWLPASFLHDPTAYAYVHPAFADVKTRALGHAIGRPKTLFAYTNQWGACVGVLTPFALTGLTLLRSRLTHRAVLALLVVSVVPIIFSVNRGLWIALGVLAAYMALGSAVRGHAKLLVSVVAAVVVLAAAIVLSPLGSIVHARVSSQVNSNATRSSLYGQAVSQVQSSPILGYGSPRPSATPISGNSHTGTQGQAFLVLFSHGIPATVAYFGWFLLTLRRTAMDPRQSGLWAAVVLVALVESPFYDFMPVTFYVVMVASALAWRDHAAGKPDPRGWRWGRPRLGRA